jgi:predicted site-specific integrase-resolvase
MSRKVKLVTPRQYAEINGVAYTTVLYWLNNGRVDGAVKHTTPFGYYWELPEDAPRPKSRAGRPTKEAASKKAAKKPAARLVKKKGAAK